MWAIQATKALCEQKITCIISNPDHVQYPDQVAIPECAAISAHHSIHFHSLPHWSWRWLHWSWRWLHWSWRWLHLHWLHWSWTWLHWSEWSLRLHKSDHLMGRFSWLARPAVLGTHQWVFCTPLAISCGVQRTHQNIFCTPLAIKVCIVRKSQPCHRTKAHEHGHQQQRECCDAAKKKQKKGEAGLLSQSLMHAQLLQLLTSAVWWKVVHLSKVLHHWNSHP